MWHGVAATEGASGAPLLAGAVGWLECRLHDEVTTGTHTLFVGEVLRNLHESGALVQDQPLSARTLEHAGVPDGVKDLIGRRLARLGERTNHVLAIAAVAGRGFDYDVL